MALVVGSGCRRLAAVRAAGHQQAGVALRPSSSRPPAFVSIRAGALGRIELIKYVHVAIQYAVDRRRERAVSVFRSDISLLCFFTSGQTSLLLQVRHLSSVWRSGYRERVLSRPTAFSNACYTYGTSSLWTSQASLWTRGLTHNPIADTASIWASILYLLWRSSSPGAALCGRGSKG